MVTPPSVAVHNHCAQYINDDFAPVTHSLGGLRQLEERISRVATKNKKILQNENTIALSKDAASEKYKKTRPALIVILFCARWQKFVKKTVLKNEY